MQIFKAASRHHHDLRMKLEEHFVTVKFIIMDKLGVLVAAGVVDRHWKTSLEDRLLVTLSAHYR
ncbi:hypothetical protein T06_10770 [Trichinella sp. T6]|nr:hypothetical protein T06_10770 [Trichinella sp. T6]